MRARAAAALVACVVFALEPAAAQELQQAEKAVIAAAKKVRPSVVTVLTPKQRDFDLTGVVIASGGVVLTLRKPLLLKSGALPKAVAVRFPGRGETVSAKVIDSDVKTDTVLLDAGGPHGRRITVGRSEDVNLGQWVLLVGNTFGAGRESTPTVSLGIVSGLHQDRTGVASVHVSALVNPGSLGAPVVDLSGRLVGITAASVTADAGQSMVVPFDRVREAYVARGPKGPGAKVLPRRAPPARPQTRIGEAFGWVLARAAGKAQRVLVGVRSRKRSDPALPSGAAPPPGGPDLAPPGSTAPGGPPRTRRVPVPEPVPGALEGIDRSSGVIVSTDGLVMCPLRITGWPDAEHDLTVDLLDGRHLPARVVGTDERLRIALLKVEARDLRVLEAAPPETVRRGTLCIALGFPHAAPGQSTPLVTVGMISRTGALDGLYPGFGALQTDAGVNGANRGGPLVDMQGRLLGVLLDVNDTERGGYRSRARARYTGNAGLGFAVPVPVLKKIQPHLELGRTLRAAYLGVSTRSAEGGLLVLSVPEKNSQGEETAAQRAGLLEGDLLLSIDAEPLTSPLQLRRFLAGFSAGDTVQIAYERAGERQTVQVKLGTR